MVLLLTCTYIGVYYIPSSHLLFCGYELIYDETYGVIYEVIMRKFRASMEPF